MTGYVMTKSRAREIVTDIAREIGPWEYVDAKFWQTDRHSIRWERSHDWIRYNIPANMLELDEDVFSSLIRVVTTAICARADPAVMPSKVVLQLRERLDYVLPQYDADGIMIAQEAR